MKFNNSLLRDMTFVNLVKQVILDLKKQYAVPGQMSVTQRQGVIVCIPKEGKEKKRKKTEDPSLC